MKMKSNRKIQHLSRSPHSVFAHSKTTMDLENEEWSFLNAITVAVCRVRSDGPTSSIGCKLISGFRSVIEGLSSG